MSAIKEYFQFVYKTVTLIVEKLWQHRMEVQNFGDNFQDVDKLMLYNSDRMLTSRERFVSLTIELGRILQAERTFQKIFRNDDVVGFSIYE